MQFIFKTVNLSVDLVEPETQGEHQLWTFLLTYLIQFRPIIG